MAVGDDSEPEDEPDNWMSQTILEGKGKHKFFVAMIVKQVSTHPEFYEGTFTFPENNKAYEVQDKKILGSIAIKPDQRGMVWTAVVHFDKKISELFVQLID